MSDGKTMQHSDPIDGKKNSYAEPRPINFTVIIAAIICALLLFSFVWLVHPYSFGPWIVEWTAHWIAVFFAPIATLLWAAFPASTWRAQSYIWLKRIILLHLILAFSAILYSCTSVEKNLTFGFFAFGAVVIDVLVILILPKTMADAKTIAKHGFWQRLVPGCLMLAIAAWSFLNIGIVLTQAQLASSGRPYCIHVASSCWSEYKPVSALIDLNGLKMHTPYCQGGSSSFQFNFHAVISIQHPDRTEWRHWSYWQQRFVPFKSTSAWPAQLPGFTRKNFCERKTDFAAKLPAF